MTAKKMYEFEVYPGKDIPFEDVWHFRFVAPNGNILGHAYNSKQSAEKSLKAFVAAVQEGRIIRKDIVITDGLKKAAHDARPRKSVIKRSVK